MTDVSSGVRSAMHSVQQVPVLLVPWGRDECRGVTGRVSWSQHTQNLEDLPCVTRVVWESNLFECGILVRCGSLVTALEIGPCPDLQQRFESVSPGLFCKLTSAILVEDNSPGMQRFSAATMPRATAISFQILDSVFVQTSGDFQNFSSKLIDFANMIKFFVTTLLSYYPGNLISRPGHERFVEIYQITGRGTPFYLSLHS